MYIVNKGVVQVIGGPTDNPQVLVELGPGSVFGEIRYVYINFVCYIMALNYNFTQSQLDRVNGNSGIAASDWTKLILLCI